MFTFAVASGVLIGNRWTGRSDAGPNRGRFQYLCHRRERKANNNGRAAAAGRHRDR